jgi:hypothetical protein
MNMSVVVPYVWIQSRKDGIELNDDDSFVRE